MKERTNKEWSQQGKSAKKAAGCTTSGMMPFPWSITQCLPCKQPWYFSSEKAVIIESSSPHPTPHPTTQKKH